LGNQTLMNRVGQHRDAVPADLVAEVLAGDADGTGATSGQDIPLQTVPLFRKHPSASSDNNCWPNISALSKEWRK